MQSHCARSREARRVSLQHCDEALRQRPVKAAALIKSGFIDFGTNLNHLPRANAKIVDVGLLILPVDRRAVCRCANRADASKIRRGESHFCALDSGRPIAGRREWRTFRPLWRFAVYRRRHSRRCVISDHRVRRGAAIRRSATLAACVGLCSQSPRKIHDKQVTAANGGTRVDRTRSHDSHSFDGVGNSSSDRIDHRYSGHPGIGAGDTRADAAAFGCRRVRCCRYPGGTNIIARLPFRRPSVAGRDAFIISLYSLEYRGFCGGKFWWLRPD